MRLRPIFFIIFLLVTNASAGQSPEIDSLKNELKNIQNENDKLAIWNELTIRYELINFDSATFYNQKVLEVVKEDNAKIYFKAKEEQVRIIMEVGELAEAEQILNEELPKLYRSTDTATLLRFYECKAIVKAYLGELDSSQHFFEIQLPLTYNNLKHRGRVYTNIATLYSTKGDIAKTIEFNFKALDNAKKLDNNYLIGLNYYNLGINYQEVRYYEKAIQYFLEGEPFVKKENDIDLLADILESLSFCYQKLGNHDKAIQYSKKALALAEEYQSSIDIVTAKYKLAGNYVEYFLNDSTYLEALQLIEEGEKVEQEPKPFDNYAYCYTKALIADYNGRKREAVKYMEKAYQIVSSYIDLIAGQINTLEKLSLFQRKAGNYPKAYEYHVLLKELSDSLINEANFATLEIQEAEYGFEMEQKIQEQKLEKAQNSVRTRTIIIIGVLLILALVSVIALVLRRANRLKAAQNDLLETQVQARTAELQTANKNLEQANYELRTFNYIASHDIKEPIRNIGSYASLIFRRLPDDLKNSLGDYFQTIKRNTTQLYTLIEDFARYTTLSKDEDIDKTNVDLNELVNGVQAGLETAIQKYNGQIINHGLPTIVSNNSLLYTIFKNIIENGLKYNQSAVPTVEVSYEKTPTHHQVFFKDNGIGIAAEYHGRIFEMFKRLHNRAEYEGSGIGLAIAKLSSNKLEGLVSVESTEGEGSIFKVELPIA